MTRAASLADVAAVFDGDRPLAGFRNAIINGNFDFWQRATTFSNPATNAYTSDRWLIIFNGTGATRTISRQVFTLGQTDVPGEPTAFYRFNQSVAGSGSTFNVISQRIEGVRTFAGQQVTVSFFARSAASLTMPALLFFQIFGTGGSPSAAVALVVSSSIVVGTTFTRFTFTATVPSISGKTIGTDGNDFLQLDFSLPLNTTFTFDLASVQVELGPVATPFERRPLGTELTLCQRYFQFLSNQLVFEGFVTGGNGIVNNIALPVPMRSVPSVIADTSNINNATNFVLNDVTPNTLRMQATATASGVSFIVYSIQLNAEL